MTKAAPNSTEEKLIPKPDVETQDAWNEALEIAKGLNDVLYAAACSDEGLNKDGCHTLEIVSDKLVDHIKTVNAFFNPEEEGD
jgi:hypothetical protein